jgi:tetratricopeptide (TPR) repeat protein
MKFSFPLFLLALAGCASSPTPEAPAPRDPMTPGQRVAAIHAAAGDDDRELAVQPLRDPQVEDLRERAQQARAAGDAAAAGDALNQALLLVPEDPAVLQERAEVALLQGDYARAETLAQRAFQLGSQVGPLCRMHWETVHQVRQHELAVLAPLPARHTPEDAARHAARAATMQAAIAEAESRRDACTVPVIERM